MRLSFLHRGLLVLLRCAAGLIVLGAIIGFRSLALPPLPDDPEQVVLQIAVSGKEDQIGRDGQIPEITLFADGRVLFVQQDEDYTLHVREARIGTDRASRWLARAGRKLGRGPDRRHEEGCMDCTEITVSWWTSEGVRRVSTYGSRWYTSPFFTLKDDLYAEALQAAHPYRPDRVVLMAAPISPITTAEPWPADLPQLPPPEPGRHYGSTLVTGVKALDLADRVPYRTPHLYVQNGQHYVVRVKPDLPILP